MAAKKKTGAEIETVHAAEMPDATATPGASDKQTAPAATTGQRIYAGASLPGLPSGTVFTGGLPGKYAKSEIVKSLCMPVDEYADFIIKKSVTTSPAAILYRKSAEYAAEIRATK